MQVLTAGKTWDVCVVGSGAGGGMAAKVLAEAGAEVVMLEAGPTWDSGKDKGQEPRRARRRLADLLRDMKPCCDLVASGFWSSRMGVEDLKYLGNTFVAEWKGCPPEVLAKIGIGEVVVLEPK